jgi:hypothetical protein
MSKPNNRRQPVETIQVAEPQNFTPEQRKLFTPIRGATYCLVAFNADGEPTEEFDLTLGEYNLAKVYLAIEAGIDVPERFRKAVGLLPAKAPAA